MSSLNFTNAAYALLRTVNITVDVLAAPVRLARNLKANIRALGAGGPF